MLENTLSEVISLSGEWQVEVGEQKGAILVPGAWEVQGYPGDTAIYRRTIDVPKAWGDAQIYLRFGAVSYYTEVYVNNERVGAHEGLWAGFEFNVTGPVVPGQVNQIELRVTKPSAKDEGKFSYRETLVGFIPYVSTTFGGAWKDIELVAHRSPAFADVHVATHEGAGLVNVRIDAIGRSLVGATVTAELVDPSGNVVTAQTETITRTYAPGHLDDFLLSMSLENIQVWSPAKPTLYTVNICLAQNGTTLAHTARRVGFRRLSADGDILMLNGEPFHVRGVLSWGWTPEKLAPIFTDDEIRAEFRRVRELGFNMVKLCLFVPSARVFEIADEEGMLLWLELPMWWQRMTDHLRAQAAEEYKAIFDEVHHHSSVVIYSLGCELDAEMANAELLGTLNTMARRATSGVLICDNSGSGEAYGGLGFDYADFNDYHFYADLHYFNPLLDHFRRDWRAPRPWIFGEFCDCDDFRDVDELNVESERPRWRQYEGVEGNLTRWAYKEQETRMEKLGLPFTGADIADISRKSSFAVRKDILEKTRARRGMGGYVVTGLRDTPISTSGMFDDMGRAKYSAEAFKRFNADTVILLEQGRARKWTHGGDRPAPMDRFNHWAGFPASFRLVVAHAGAPLDARHIRWRLESPRGEVHAEGGEAIRHLILGGVPRELAAIELSMPQVEKAQRWTLYAELEGVTANQWSMWVYPCVTNYSKDIVFYDPAGQLYDLGRYFTRVEDTTSTTNNQCVMITSVFDGRVANFAASKGNVLIMQPGPAMLFARRVPFWREAIKLIHPHPALANFPHDGYADAQFYHLAPDYAFDSDTALRTFEDLELGTPIMQRLDARLFTLLDYIVEFRVGTGRMIASTLRFFGGTGDQVRGLDSNVAGYYLLHELLANLLTSR